MQWGSAEVKRLRTAELDELIWDSNSPHYSIRMFQLENSWTEFDEIWYERYANGVHSNLVRFNLLHPVITIWQTREYVQ
jgi:hypothetical protein